MSCSTSTGGRRDPFERTGARANMEWHNIFFALALAENTYAAYCFGAACRVGNRVHDKAAYGLTAAISAAKSYMFGVWLKSQADKSEE